MGHEGWVGHWHRMKKPRWSEGVVVRRMSGREVASLSRGCGALRMESRRNHLPENQRKTK